MTPASELVIHAANITGIPQATVVGIKRRFVETGIWPSSRGAHVPELGSYHLTMLLLALLADVPAKDAASSAGAYYSLADPSGNKLGETLQTLIESFRTTNDVAALAYKSRLEVDCGFPRACLSMACTDGQAETLYGVQAVQWSDVRVRRSMTISGKVLFDLAMGLHFNRWPDEDTAIA